MNREQQTVIIRQANDDARGFCEEFPVQRVLPESWIVVAFAEFFQCMSTDIRVEAWPIYRDALRAAIAAMVPMDHARNVLDGNLVAVAGVVYDYMEITGDVDAGGADTKTAFPKLTSVGGAVDAFGADTRTAFPKLQP